MNNIAFAVPSMDKKLIKGLEDKIFNFIWKGPDKVARVDAKKKEIEGGLALPDISASWSAFKISWLRRIEYSNTTWAELFCDSLTQIDLQSKLGRTGLFYWYCWPFSNR